MHIDEYKSSISSKDKKHAIVLHFNGVKYEVFTLELIIVDWIQTYCREGDLKVILIKRTHGLSPKFDFYIKLLFSGLYNFPSTLFLHIEKLRLNKESMLGLFSFLHFDSFTENGYSECRDV